MANPDDLATMRLALDLQREEINTMRSEMLPAAENADFLNQLTSLDLQISDLDELETLYHEETVNMGNAHGISEVVTLDQQRHEQTLETEDISENPETLATLKETEEITEGHQEQVEVIGGHSETEANPGTSRTEGSREDIVSTLVSTDQNVQENIQNTDSPVTGPLTDIMRNVQEKIRIINSTITVAMVTGLRILLPFTWATYNMSVEQHQIPDQTVEQEPDVEQELDVKQEPHQEELHQEDVEQPDLVGCSIRAEDWQRARTVYLENCGHDLCSPCLVKIFRTRRREREQLAP